MRRIRYQVATSLDGYIAGPKGEADWIIMAPEIDFRNEVEYRDLPAGRRDAAMWLSVSWAEGQRPCSTP